MQTSHQHLTNFDITESLREGLLFQSGFTALLLGSLSEGLCASVLKTDLAQVCVFLYCRSAEQEPIYRFEVQLSAASALGRAHSQRLPMLLPENILPVAMRNALWKELPIFNPGSFVRSSHHEPADSAELLMIANDLDGNLPSGHRPFEVRFLPPPSRIITSPFSFASLSEQFPERQETTLQQINAAVRSDNLPIELHHALSVIKAPQQSGEPGSALAYVQRFAHTVLFTNTLGTPDLYGCWHPVASFAHVFDVQSTRTELAATAFVSMVAQIEPQANSHTVNLWSRVQLYRRRSIVELFDLLIDAAAKLEVFARSGARPQILREVEVAALERFATKRRLEMLSALEAVLQNGDFGHAPCWQGATATAGTLRKGLEQRLTMLQQRQTKKFPFNNPTE